MGLFKKKEYVYSNVKLADLLPVGSIVKIKGDDSKYMISNYRGFAKAEVTHNKKKFIEVDYWLIPYPEGFTFDAEEKPISASDIEEVIFRGFSDERRENFISNVEKG